ncbi:MAG: hypothetical protein KGI67_02050 [Pseudomonadota bacterium]|nr:hypothetical protein [Pseudomonadota bacterium]
MRSHSLPGGLALLLLATLVGHAQGEESVSLSVVSDQIYRGRTWSNGGPTVVTGLGFDFAGGAYAGVTMVPVRFPGQPAWQLAILPYAGIAGALSSTLAWDVGVSAASFSHSSPRNEDEAYLGLSGERLVARLYLPMRKPGVGSVASYAEASLKQPMPGGIQLDLHAGLLAPGAREAPFYGRQRAQWDLRLAAALPLEEFTAGVALVTTVNADGWSPDAHHASYYLARPARELVLSLSRAF